jgi:lipopolysaccharide transport system ATP-binding protein
MSDCAIKVENLGKRYSLRHQINRGDGLRHVLQRTLLSPFRKANPRKAFNGTAEEAVEVEDFWALRGVSFEIKPGDVVGIIGRNGAGKSTLLKILSRITDPTEGRITLNGRVASLLEVGTGFHPELTGRENIYLNGTILGMTRGEITKKFDEIVAFAEVEQFLDTAVKHYSSGMYVRLAFAVAAHLEPEILVVDEVLAVGDVQFQQKCLGKMQDVSRQEGRTVLFVSHNMSAITSLCKQVIVLNKGAVDFTGSPQEGIDIYMAKGGQQEAMYAGSKSKKHPKFTRVEIDCSLTKAVHESGKPWKITFEIDYPRLIIKPCLAFQIYNQFQHPVLRVNAYDSDITAQQGIGVTTVECTIPKLDLNVGTYSVKVHLCEPPGGEVFDVVENICAFEVVVMNKTTFWGWRPAECAYFVDSVWSLRNSTPSGKS